MNCLLFHEPSGCAVVQPVRLVDSGAELYVRDLEALALDFDLFSVSGGVHVLIIEFVQNQAIRPVLDYNLRGALLSDEVPEAVL